MNAYERVLVTDVGNHPITLLGAYKYFVDDDG